MFTFLCSIKFFTWSYWIILQQIDLTDRIQTGTTTLSQSWPWSNSIEGVLHNLQDWILINRCSVVSYSEYPFFSGVSGVLFFYREFKDSPTELQTLRVRITKNIIIPSMFEKVITLTGAIFYTILRMLISS